MTKDKNYGLYVVFCAKFVLYYPLVMAAKEKKGKTKKFEDLKKEIGD